MRRAKQSSGGGARRRTAVWIVLVACWGAMERPAGAVEAARRYVVEQAGPDRFPLAAGGSAAPLVIDEDDHAGVAQVADLLQADLERVAGVRPALLHKAQRDSGPPVLIGTLGRSRLIDALAASGKLDVAGLAGRWETFVVQAIDAPLPGIERALVIAGSDKRGTIFGMFDLSAQIGVSPWSWWADVPVERREALFVLPGRHTRGEPAVKYRGIFINDEAPALAGWAQEKFGGFNHRFYEKVFELILRLRGNYLWPAMWGRAIYDDDPRSPQLADLYGVVLGTSHHEPLMRAHVEWQRYGQGPWNYEQNPTRLRNFWTEGIRRMGDHESIVTIGMRGDGDKPMTEDANIALLERIVADQRKIIGEVTGRAPAEQPQLWALYKEVQEYYDRGMRVPDDVTLLLCDDNWGNLRKLPQLDQPRRPGGYGIYYHFDYVGGPRNYKWVNTNPLPRIWEQLHLAYRHGVERVWIVNVGDIKPMELPTEFFLDYAWNPEAWPVERLGQYTRRWAARQFGDRYAGEIAELLASYLKFNSRRKPELLDPETYSLVHYREAERVVAHYQALAERAAQIEKRLPAEAHDAYYQLVLYPIQACSNLNELYLAAAQNRWYAEQGRAATNERAERVAELFARDAEMSRHYNQQLAGGKWNHMADQTHIGYTHWQQPEKNTMPDLRTIDLPAEAEMGVALEGARGWWPEERRRAELPELVPWEPAGRYVEIFNRGQEPFEFTVAAEADWIDVQPAHGLVADQQRVWVRVDWDAAPAGTERVPIAIQSSTGSRVVVDAPVNRPSDAELPAGTFREANGYVSIEAVHYAQAVDAPPIRWRELPDLGRTLSAMTTMPVTAASTSPGEPASPRLEYRVNLSSRGPVTLKALVAPTLDYHDRGGLRYAVSFDDAAPQVVNLHADQSLPSWETWVANSINVTGSEHQIDQPGQHVLKFWRVDPGVVLQKLVIETADVGPSYLGPPESGAAAGAPGR